MRHYKLKMCKRVHGIHFAPDGTRLLAVSGASVRTVDCAMWLDLASGVNDDRIYQSAECYAVSPDVSRYVLGGANYWQSIPAVAWKEFADSSKWHGIPKWDEFATLSLFDVSGLSFDTTGARLAISHGRRSDVDNIPHAVSIIHCATGIAEMSFEVEDASRVIVFNADDTRLAVTGGMYNNPIVILYDLAANKRVFAFTPAGASTRSVQFLPDNRLVVTNGRNVYVLPPDIRNPQPIFTLAGHLQQVNATAPTPDGNRLLTASHDGTIRTWNANTGEAISTFDWKIGAITAVSFAPDGLTCAAAGLSGKIVVWDVDG